MKSTAVLAWPLSPGVALRASSNLRRAWARQPGVHQPELLCHRGIRFPAIREQNPPVILQQPLRYCPSSGCVVVEEHDPPPRWTAGPYPHPVLGGGRLVAMQDLQTRLVTVDQRMLEHLLVQEVNEWHQVRAAQADHPAGHGR